MGTNYGNEGVGDHPVTTTALGTLLVMEIGDSVAGAYAGKLFADYGSEVHVIREDDASVANAFFDASKHVVEVDVAETADVVIQSSSNDPLTSLFQPCNPQ